MERMVQLYAAPTEYLAVSAREALSAAGVPCVIVTNEIPMEPGYNFGAAWAYACLYVDVSDEDRAREAIQDMLATLCAEDRGAEAVYPRRINLRSYHWVALAVPISWGLMLLPLLGPGFSTQQSVKRMNDTVLEAFPFTWMVYVLINCLSLAMLAALIYANWHLVKRTVLALAEAFLGLIVLPFWLLFELVRWGWGKLIRPAPMDA